MPEIRKRKAQYLWYMTGIMSYVAPFGIQMILFPWLIAVQLQESAARLGIAQMTTQLPGLFLILVGGLLADRIDGRKIVIYLQLLSAIPVLTIAILIYQGYLSYPMLIVYALTVGTIHAFINPARDGMLNREAPV